MSTYYQCLPAVRIFKINTFLNSLSLSDGLTDCVDPDCCEQLSCGSDPLCHGSADPSLVLQQNPQPTTTSSASTSMHTHSFYYRIRFLLGKAATHTLPGDVPFDTRYVLVYSLRARVCACMWISPFYLSSVCVLEYCVICWKPRVAPNKVKASVLMH